MEDVARVVRPGVDREEIAELCVLDDDGEPVALPLPKQRDGDAVALAMVELFHDGALRSHRRLLLFSGRVHASTLRRGAAQRLVRKPDPASDLPMIPAPTWVGDLARVSGDAPHVRGREGYEPVGFVNSAVADFQGIPTFWVWRKAASVPESGAHGSRLEHGRWSVRRLLLGALQVSGGGEGWPHVSSDRTPRSGRSLELWSRVRPSGARVVLSRDRGRGEREGGSLGCESARRRARVEQHDGGDRIR